MSTKKLSTALVVILLSVGNVAFASVITGGLSSQGVIPVVPSGVTATKTSDKQIKVSWSPVASVEGYRVYRIKDGSQAQTVGTTTLSSFEDSNLAAGIYSYQVESFVGDLRPSLSSILPTPPITISVSTPSPAPSPPAPGGGGGGGGSGGIFIPSRPAAKKVDVNKDGKINILDFNVLMVNWGSPSVNNAADFDGNGKVDILDFNLLLINWTL